MGVRYPDQVGGHKPCVPGFDLILREDPRVDRATTCWKYALEAIIKGLLLYFIVHDNCLLFML